MILKKNVSNFLLNLLFCLIERKSSGRASGFKEYAMSQENCFYLSTSMLLALAGLIRIYP